MAQDLPDIPELVRTANEFIERIVPKLDGQDRYHAMCTKFLLEIVERELSQWTPTLTTDDMRLMNFLGDETFANGAETIAALSAAIRTGSFDQRMEELLPVLIKHVESKVEITKPSYLDEHT